MTWASPTTPSSSTRPTTARTPTPGPTPRRRRSAARRTPTGRALFACPAFIRWPGHIKPDSVSNEIVSGLDWLPTLVAAAGDPDVKQKLLKGYTVGGMTYKVHLDGYNLLPYLTGQEPKSPRREFFYFSDDCDLLALRYENWKFVFAEQRMPGTLAVWSEPFTRLRGGKMFDLRADPYERADITSNTYYDWQLDHAVSHCPRPRPTS